MKPEAQRIAIAEHCGFERWIHSDNPSFVKLCRPRDDNQRKYWLSVGCRTTDEAVCAVDDDVPDYLYDLNAMHEAESHIHGDDWASYFDWLQKNGNARGVRATAAQRAEAFLRTKGLWKD